LFTHLPNEPATLALGAKLAHALRPGMKIYLSGELGSGKTTLVRGVLRALGFEQKVKSPTYALVESYQLSCLYLQHFDFYRFKESAEWEDAGFRELFDAADVCLVEWPERAGDRLPEPDLSIRLSTSGDARDAEIQAHTALGKEGIKFFQE
jgi:tRNA threonylcarbamoyladenosine biosynthesis protein TsaE